MLVRQKTFKTCFTTTY